ncbi:MAG: DUF721 domain-containing protein [Myxococcales bacterium]|nr:MAG: DUF721 domain-containing protein [Myxococcales bacterium]
MARARRNYQNGSFLGELIAKSKFGPKGLPDPRVLRWWIYKVPERVNEFAWPVRLQKGVLTVHTQNSALANDLHYLRDELLASARQHMGPGIVTDIRLHVGKMPYHSVSTLINQGRVLPDMDKQG